MMCESVSEYEPDMDFAIDDETVEAIAKELAPVVDAYDPVTRLSTKLSDDFQKITSLLDYDIGNDNRDRVQAVEELSEYASRLADRMRCVLMKQKGISSLLYNTQFISDGKWVLEDIRNNLGFIMKNYTYLRQQGYDTIRTKVSVLPNLYMYDIVSILNAYMSSVDGILPDLPFDIEQMRNLLRLEDDKFSTTYDMLKCIITDPERLSRLEVENDCTIDVSELVHDATYYPYTPIDGEKSNSVLPKLITFISKRLRLIKTTAYDLTTTLYGNPNEYEHADEYEAVMKKLIAGVVDIFFVPAVFMYALAYGMRREFAIKNAVSEYAKTIRAMKIE